VCGTGAVVLGGCCVCGTGVVVLGGGGFGVRLLMLSVWHRGSDYFWGGGVSEFGC
jgi:hypothetical protein